MIQEITNSNAENFVSRPIPSIVEFYSPSCVHCKRMLPILEELSGSNAVGKCDVTQNTELAERYNVTMLPTILFFRDGEIKNELIGFTPKEVIEDNLKRA